jgi:hypothetical protein
MPERCSCGHLPAEHLMAVGSNGPGIYQCEASISRDRTCGCGQYAPPPADPQLEYDLEIDEELPWRAA